MLASFRRMSKSSIGSFILVLFGLLIAASFAMTDMSGSSFGRAGGSSSRPTARTP